ncbi:Gfo/Idh/MocA family oxidoreductase [Brucella melitensis]|uniref:Gfo/Idh/MocA family protein n=1 Tax=Brucella melitensis TaxID=29459 RepID=UPI002F358E98
MTQNERIGGDFRWGIWGTDMIASSFAADIAASAGMRVVAVCSHTTQTAQAFCRHIGINKAFGNPHAFLADPEIDAVYIASPNMLHVEQALDAIMAGKACLIEKPLSLDPEGARQIETASKARNIFAMEAMWTRFLPAVQAVKHAIDASRIGTVTHIEADLSYSRAYDPESRFFSPALGGGAAFDLGVYPLSLALYFLGLPEKVDGHCQRAASGVDLRSEFNLGWPSATAWISCGFDRDGENRMLIEGTDGAILIHPPFLKAQRLTFFSRSALHSPCGPKNSKGRIGNIINRLPLPGRTIETHAFAGNGLQFQAQAVRDAIRRGEISTPIMPLAQSAAVADIISRVLVSG